MINYKNIFEVEAETAKIEPLISNMNYGDILYEQLIAEGKIEDVWERYYKSALSLESFNIIVSGDPTTIYGQDELGAFTSDVKKIGDYVKWLMKFYTAAINKRRFLTEDLPQYRDALIIFDRAKKANKLPPDKKDINKFKDLLELNTFIEQYDENLMSKRQAERNAENEIRTMETKVLHDGPKWLIVIPLTHRSDCLWGADTKWCTASRTNGKYYFNQYSDEGPLYICINKQNKKRFQFHFPTQQFMDINDSPVNFEKMVDNDEELSDAFFKDVDMSPFPDIVPYLVKIRKRNRVNVDATLFGQVEPKKAVEFPSFVLFLSEINGGLSRIYENYIRANSVTDDTDSYNYTLLDAIEDLDYGSCVILSKAISDFGIPINPIGITQFATDYFYYDGSEKRKNEKSIHDKLKEEEKKYKDYLCEIVVEFFPNLDKKLRTAYNKLYSQLEADAAWENESYGINEYLFNDDDRGGDLIEPDSLGREEKNGEFYFFVEPQMETLAMRNRTIAGLNSDATFWECFTYGKEYSTSYYGGEIDTSYFNDRWNEDVGEIIADYFKNNKPVKRSPPADPNQAGMFEAKRSVSMNYEDLLYEQLIAEGKLEDVYAQYYSKSLTLEDFLKIVNTDPTTVVVDGEVKKIGDYVKWIMMCFKSAPNKRRFIAEDLYRYRDTLTTFDRAKKANKLPIDKKDINKFPDVVTLSQLTDQFQKEEELVSKREQVKKEENEVRTKETKIFHDGPKWLVVIPLTHRSDCLWGADTSWCTASRGHGLQFFNNYNSQGPLYVCINKQNKVRYQLHFETNQYMDVKDHPIELMNLLNDEPELMNAFCKDLPKESFVDVQEIEAMEVATHSMKKIKALVYDNIPQFLQAAGLQQLIDIYYQYVGRKPVHKYYELDRVCDIAYMLDDDTIGKIIEALNAAGETAKASGEPYNIHEVGIELFNMIDKKYIKENDNGIYADIWRIIASTYEKMENEAYISGYWKDSSMDIGNYIGQSFEFEKDGLYSTYLYDNKFVIEVTPVMELVASRLKLHGGNSTNIRLIDFLNIEINTENDFDVEIDEDFFNEEIQKKLDALKRKMNPSPPSMSELRKLIGTMLLEDM